MKWDLVLQILGSVFGFIVAIYKIRLLNPNKNPRFKDDIELLKELEKDSESYIAVKTHIDNSIRKIYSVKQNKKIIKDAYEFVFGIFFIVVFTLWSVHIYSKNQGFSGWILLKVSLSLLELR